MLAKPFRYTVQQMGGGVVAHAGPFPASNLDKIIVQQHKQMVGMEKTAFLIDYPEAVGITVRCNAEIAVAVLDNIGK